MDHGSSRSPIYIMSTTYAAMVKAQNKRIDKLIKHIREGCEAKEEVQLESTMCNLNPYIECLNPDILYHLSLRSDTTDFQKVFGDVRVC